MSVALHEDSPNPFSEYWIVDPIARQIDFFVCDGEHFRVTFPHGTTYDSPVLGAIEFDLAEFWREVGG